MLVQDAHDRSTTNYMKYKHNMQNIINQTIYTQYCCQFGDSKVAGLCKNTAAGKELPSS